MVSQPVMLKPVLNVTLTSPQVQAFTHEDILSSPDNYDLKNSISLKSTNESMLPYWITENLAAYSAEINTAFSVNAEINLQLYFEIKDY